jgi:hypothetical protein
VGSSEDSVTVPKKERWLFSWKSFLLRIRVRSIPTLGAPVDKDLATDFDRTSEQYIPEDLPDLESMVKRVTARYEVILAAGSVGSGQLLMLSGIGPKDHLHERSIEGKGINSSTLMTSYIVILHRWHLLRVVLFL